MTDKNKEIYYSLDEAREELKKRWNNKELKDKVLTILKDKTGVIPVFLEDEPQAVIWRSMLSPDNGFDFYYQSSKYIGCNVSPLEYLSDKFVTINEEKKALSNIKLSINKKEKVCIELTEYSEEEGKSLVNVELRNGGNLHEFHSSLFIKNYDGLNITDISEWCCNIGKAKDYYYYYLLHFVCLGVLFESFSFEITKENSFTNEIIIPAIEKIEKELGFKPLIVRLYPENQTEEEDFYWFSYPKGINDYIIEYAKNNNYLIKKYK